MSAPCTERAPSSLAFIVPAHGRLELARICLRQLRRTCDALGEHGIHASAFVIGDDDNLNTAHELGFGTIHRDNRFLGRKFNDGFQVACDPKWNPRPADFAVPFGTDDWIDYRLLLDLPDSILAFRRLCIVHPKFQEMDGRAPSNEGGCGIRVYPRSLLGEVGYRPTDEDRNWGCDTSTLVNLKQLPSFRITYRDNDSRQIVDWKSLRDQVTPYHSVRWRRTRERWEDPFSALAELYPPEALEEMRSLSTSSPASATTARTRLAPRSTPVSTPA